MVIEINNRTEKVMIDNSTFVKIEAKEGCIGCSFFDGFEPISSKICSRTKCKKKDELDEDMIYVPLKVKELIKNINNPPCEITFINDEIW